MKPLLAHQETILRLLDSRPRFAIFAEQGTGKTLPMLAHILRLVKSGRIGSALVVCPKAVRASWERDIVGFFNPFEQKLIRRALTVTTYDLVWRRQELYRNWDFICLDESHFIKNRTSNRYCGQVKTVTDTKTGKKKRVRVTGGIKGLSEGAAYRYIMTGTPIGNSHWEELWAQFDFLDPDIFGKYQGFERRYCVLNQFFKPYAYLHTDELREIYHAHSYTVTKTECLDLPDKLPPERYTLELLEWPKYREMLKNYIEEWDIEAANPLARLAKLRQLCSGFILDEHGVCHLVRCEKTQTLTDFMESWAAKLVIFAEFKESIRAIAATLKKLRVPFITLDGDQKDKAIWRRFQAEPELQVIICQYRTASAGIDLFAADTMLFWEPTNSSQTFEQACDRIHRVGQNRKCSYILFETAGTVEVKMWDALMRHRDFNEQELRTFVQSERRIT